MSSQDHAASDPQLKRWYGAFNRHWFNSELPDDVVIFWEPAHGNLGECEVDEDDKYSNHHLFEDGEWLIRIDPCLRFSSTISKLTLLHEMVHVRTSMAKPSYQGHGAPFQREMLRLATIGALKKLW